MAGHTLFDSEDAAGKPVAFHVTLEQKVPAGYLWMTVTLLTRATPYNTVQVEGCQAVI